MRKINKLLLLSIASLLASCGSLNNKEAGSINYDDLDNYDIDQINDITEDDETSSPTNLDDIKNQEGEIEAPAEYDSFSNGTLSKSGKYYLKGEYSKIWISASKGSELYVFLDGATISSNEGIAFGSDKQITLHLILLNNSNNDIKNDYAISESLSEANAFHVKGDVYISGEGILNVSSTVKTALKVSKNLYITDPVTINATSKSHSIAAQSVSIANATLNLKSSDKDGINAECDGKVDEYTTEQGFVVVENANINIDTYGDGIQAASFIDISGGSTNIVTHGQFIAYSSSLISSGEYVKDDFKYVKNGNSYKRVASDEIRNLSSSYYALVNSVKGLKVAGVEYEDESGNTKEVTSGDYEILIHHLADIVIESTDDCIHTNYGNVNVKSSNFELSTLDDGMHADYSLNVDNCSIVIKSSYEGLEGGNVVVDGERTNLVSISSDDGINAASDYVKENNITINNGYLRVFASGDGVDANSSLIINGGTLIVEGPGNNNGSLDAENVKINGGLVFACSTNGMQERTSATQNAFLYQGTSFASGSLITIADSNDEALFSYTLKQSCNQIIFSSKDLVLKSTYKILNGTSTVASITLTSTYTKVGSNSQGGGPGGGGPGGDPHRNGL